MSRNDVSFHSNFWSIIHPLLSDRMGLGDSVQGLRDGLSAYSWYGILGLNLYSSQLLMHLPNSHTLLCCAQ